MCTQHRYTPLHAASYKGYYDVVKTLMEANADKDLLTEVTISMSNVTVKGAHTVNYIKSCS